MSTLPQITDHRSRAAAGHRLPAGDPAALPLGAHLVARRRGYRHHGIYVGDGKVVHYAGLSRSWRRGPVEEVSLARFAAGRAVLVKPAANARYDSEEVVRRARSRLGEDRYRIARNNCEHFCEWCLRGEPRSEQVENFLAAPLLAPLRALLRRYPSLARPFCADPVESPADRCAA